MVLTCENPSNGLDNNIILSSKHACDRVRRKICDVFDMVDLVGSSRGVVLAISQKSKIRK